MYPRKNKYSAKRTEVDGITFDSKAEANRYIKLKGLVEDGLIWGLELQPEYTFPINGEVLKYPSKRVVKYRADFRYQTPAGEVVEDVKGMDTMTSKIKRSLVKHIHKIEVQIVK
jgi:hypothetical protein